MGFKWSLNISKNRDEPVIGYLISSHSSGTVILCQLKVGILIFVDNSKLQVS